MTESPNPYHVLIAGAGVAALEAALALRALAGELVSVELVAPETEFAYRPLSVAEPFRVADMRRFPLESLVEATGATLRKGIVANVDSEQKHVVLESGEALPYDAVLLALGARPQEAVPGAQIFRGAQDRADVVALLDQACLGDIRRLVFAVPAGTTWPLALYELALLTAE